MNALDRTVAPAVHPIVPLPLPEVRRVTLDNGLRLVVLPCPTLEIARFTAVIEGGACEASPMEIASITAAMRSKGTKSHDAAQIAHEIDINGSWTNAGNGPHFSTSTVFALDQKAAAVLPVFAETIFEPTFPEKELETAKKRLAARLQVNETTVGYQSSVLSSRLTFGEAHPLARVMTPAGYLALSRNEIVDFRQRYTRPANITLFAVGNITAERESFLNGVFGNHSFEPVQTAAAPLNIVPFAPAAGGTAEKVEVADAAQSAVTITLPGLPRNHPDYLALRLAVMALGGYFGSRLSQNIREDKGMTYGITAALLGYREGGVVQIATRCDASYVDAVIAETFREIDRMGTDIMSAEEMARMRQAEIASLIETTDSPFSTMDFYQTLLTYDLPADYFSSRCRIAATITAEEILDCARRYLRSADALTAVAGK